MPDQVNNKNVALCVKGPEISGRLPTKLGLNKQKEKENAVPVKYRGKGESDI